MKLETIASSFTPKGMKYDGMPFHRSAGGITRPEVGAELAFAGRIASAAFQVKIFDDQRYIPPLKALLLEEVYKKYPQTESAESYVDLAIYENCLHRNCKVCEGRRVVSRKHEVSGRKRGRIRVSVNEETRSWERLEKFYAEGITSVATLVKKSNLPEEKVLWYVIKKEYHDWVALKEQVKKPASEVVSQLHVGGLQKKFMDNDSLPEWENDPLLKERKAYKESIEQHYKYTSNVKLLAEMYSVSPLEISKRRHEWDNDLKPKSTDERVIPESLDKTCPKCNGSGKGVMLEKERAEFIGITSKSYSAKHKNRYNYIYTLLRDQLDKINVN
ncbi:hypothetical protein [Piscirickettsia litoralis]|uniref:Uncharacterized protein n=1 Tax=Piscirickettsia litoralis TaxID=1891921 RepID=A0ABX2ZXL6_9GAMM|nr:hypothetical protein [Piscirickettsia litoralis]ODN41124.1 hypothetical protein BGC07_17775 [Piscirickettsia litoralis]